MSNDRRAAFATRVFARLQWLLPRAYRDRHGDESLAMFRRVAGDAARSGGLRLLRTTLIASLDLVRVAIVLRLGALRASLRPGFSGGEVTGDVRLAWRGLRRAPTFAFAAISTLAVAIAGATVVFSVLNAVLLRALPLPASERLVQIFETSVDASTGAVDERGYFAWENYTDVRDVVAGFASIAAWQYYDRTLSGIDQAVRLSGRMVTPRFFDVVGVRPQIGRALDADDAVQGRENVAVIGYGVWQSAFGGDPSVVGRTIRLDGAPWTIVGVMPRDFGFPYDGELWMPLIPELGPDGQGARRYHRYRVAGRLADGAMLDAVRLRLDDLAARTEAAHPATNTGYGLRVVPLQDVIVGAARTSIRVLAAAVGLLLLIACANIAGLFLVRASDRGREFGVRAALGASRARIFRQLLTESVVIAGIGGMLGLLLAVWGVRAFLALVGDALPRAGEVGFDASTFVFAAGVTMLAGIVSGVLPALRQSRRSAQWLRGRGNTADAAAGRLRGLFAAIEVALAVVLVTGAGLFAVSLARLRSVDVGFEPAGLVTLDLSLPESVYPASQRARVFDDIVERTRSLPGVRHAAAGLTWPLGGIGWGNGLRIEGRPVPEADLPTVSYIIVTAGWFAAAGIALDGADVQPGAAGSGQTIVVNRALVRRFFPAGDAIGRRIRFSDDQPWSTIVGIAADVPPSIGEAVWPTVYPPTSLESLASMSLVVRVSDDARTAAVAASVRSLVRGIDPDIVIASVSTMDARLDQAVSQQRYTSIIVGLFASIALLLACLGVYGLLAHVVGTRTREVGIRLAVGARSTDVVALVVRQGLQVTAAGIVAGIGASLGLARLVTSLLFETSTFDPLVLAGVVVLVGSFSLVASGVPAARAARISPVRALGSD